MTNIIEGLKHADHRNTERRGVVRIEGQRRGENGIKTLTCFQGECWKVGSRDDGGGGGGGKGYKMCDWREVRIIELAH